MTRSRLLHVSPATRSRRRRFGARGLREECEQLRELCRVKEYATEEELAAYWPGGTENADRSLDAWIYCFQQLGRFLGRKELMERARESARDELEGAVRAASAKQPQPVALSVGLYAVHPKSAWALEYLSAIERVLQPVFAAQLEAAEVAEQTNQAVVWPEVVRGLAVRTWVWIVTHPGPELPWTDAQLESDPPAWTAQITPQDLLVVDQAHRAVNNERLRIMAAAFPASDGGGTSRLALGGFLAGYAHEHGIAPADVVRRWSLGEVFAAAVSAADAQQQAEARAEAKAAKHGRTNGRAR